MLELVNVAQQGQEHHAALLEQRHRQPRPLGLGLHLMQSPCHELELGASVHAPELHRAGVNPQPTEDLVGRPVAVLRLRNGLVELADGLLQHLNRGS